jgi:hypothetical protein
MTAEVGAAGTSLVSACSGCIAFCESTSFNSHPNAARRKAMTPKIVHVPSVKEPIAKSPGFAKKQLSDYKLDRIGLCGFGCIYCSSNWGNFLRINRELFADLTEAQTGKRTYPTDDPSLMFDWPDFEEKFETQLEKKPRDWGKGQTLVYSMLTDGFSPMLVRSGQTEAILRTVLERTQFRIRVLTKNAIVGQPKWLNLFAEHHDRFVIGLSIGSMDDEWAKRVELFTPPPSRRIVAINHVQDAASQLTGCYAQFSRTYWKVTGSKSSLIASARTWSSTSGPSPTTTGKTGRRFVRAMTRVARAISG